MRHRWAAEHRTHGSWHATYARCGIIRDKRFAYDAHWTEWQRPWREVVFVRLDAVV